MSMRCIGCRDKAREDRAAAVDVTEKVCGGCDQLLPTEAFGSRVYAKSGRPVLRSRCLECERADSRVRNAGKVNPNAEQNYLRHKAKVWGVDPDGLLELARGRDGHCEICGRLAEEAHAGKRLAIDHSHETGAVRGLLCAACNTAIGLLQDDPEVIARAAAYLQQPPALLPLAA
jgi:hypothetical protein